MDIFLSKTPFREVTTKELGGTSSFLFYIDFFVKKLYNFFNENRFFE